MSEIHMDADTSKQSSILWFVA